MDLKLCKRCGETKPFSEFKKKSGINLKLAKSPQAHYITPCRVCLSDKYKDNKQAKIGARKRHLKHKYNIESEVYDEMLEKQKGKCGICNSVFEIYCVDHNHETGKIRGLLCSSCNKGLGMFTDDIEKLKRAIKYLNP